VRATPAEKLETIRLVEVNLAGDLRTDRA
jgi:hypothetical protein